MVELVNDSMCERDEFIEDHRESIRDYNKSEHIGREAESGILSCVER